LFVQIRVHGLKIKASESASVIELIQERAVEFAWAYTFERENRTYKVHDLFIEHNHILQTAQTSHLMPSQRNISKHQAMDI